MPVVPAGVVGGWLTEFFTEVWALHMREGGRERERGREGEN